MTVVGAGLAGCEAAWQLACRKIPVTIIEMRPKVMSPAHHGDGFAELVCSNSLRSDDVENAVGLLKQEMRLLGSLIMQAADHTRIPAGKALAVDREGFTRFVTQHIRQHPMITVINQCVERIPDDPCIIATGPLTTGTLAADIERIAGAVLSFFDAAAPIVTTASLNVDRMYKASRYGGDHGADYWNCPMDQQQFQTFWEALCEAEQQPLHGFEDHRVFEGCVPIEVMARRGMETIAHGPMKPVGLPDPTTGREPYAVVQLRQDDWAGELYNIVGFQTHLKFPEQRRVFRMIPGLEHAEFARYGVMHRNSFLRSPGFLDQTYRCITRSTLFFAGQITGVEGYVESAASGLMAGLRMANDLRGQATPDFTKRTAIGALGYYIANAPAKHFQPMNICYGIMEPLGEKIRVKRMRNQLFSQRALCTMTEILKQYPEMNAIAGDIVEQHKED